MNPALQFRRRGLSLLLALAVTLAALGLRLRAVERLPIDYDEDDYFRTGQHYAAAFLDQNWGELVDYSFNLEHPPFYKIVYGAVLSGLPQLPEVAKRPLAAPPAASLPQPHLNALRSVSAALGTLEVLALALLDPLAGALLAVHTFTIKYTSQVYLEALPALLSLASVLAYTRSKGSLRPRTWLALSAIGLGLTAASKYLYAMVGIAILLHWIWETQREAGQEGSRRWEPWRTMFFWGAFALLVFFLADPYLWPDPIGRLKASIAYNTGYAQGEQVQRAGLPPWQPLVWLLQPVPWHPGVFLVSLDALIALLALARLKCTWQKHPVFIFWLGVGLVFLLVWPTKWPQYILMITAPVCLAAAEGLRAGWEPLSTRLKQPQALSRPSGPRHNTQSAWKALPWLLPGLLVLGLIAMFPLVYQLAMALTDFRATAIRDGLTGGVWREVWLGLSGQVEPVAVEIFSQSLSRAREVHYAGLAVLYQLISGLGPDLLVFEVIWTVLSVSAQLLLGLGLALLLSQKGLLFRRFWLVIFILPWAIPEFVGMLIWQRMFEPRFGWLVLATSFPDTPGYPPSLNLAGWQQDPGLALGVLLVAATWYGFPLILVAATAALKMIPGEVYDAADMDGANGWARFRWVTWPMVLPLLMPALIIRAIFAFNQFYLFYVLGTPYPLITFATLSFFVFDANSGYGGQFALSAAINILTVALLVFFLLWFNRWSKAGEGLTYA